MKQPFCIVGPTATGKSELAADIAVRLEAEIVSADAFQVYEGFDLLSAKPGKEILEKVPHHLIGAVSATREMSAARYRELALPVIDEITLRGKRPMLVGGSGLYVKALTDGLDDIPPADSRLREELNRMSTGELRKRLTDVDPVAAETVDLKNRRRLIRAIEIALTTGRPASGQRTRWITARSGGNQSAYAGVFVFRDRDELYQRINQRVETMLTRGAIEEVRYAGTLSSTVEQMIGIKDVRRYLAGDISRAECVAAIQQATRRYAKRQLTWFRHQSKFRPLNLSLLTHTEAVQWVSRWSILERAVND